MPRAVCPPGASVSALTVAFTVRAEARMRPDDCTHPALLPASARIPREGAVWLPPRVPPKYRRVALAVWPPGRWISSAGARLRREGHGSALPILDASVRYRFPTWRSMSPLGQSPSVGNEYRGLALWRAGWRLRHGLSAAAIGRCHCGIEPGPNRALRLVVVMHCIALRLIPALPRRPPGQGDRLRRANKNPGPPRGPGRADRAA